MLDKNAKIYIAGHAGLLGSALHSKLKGDGYKNVIIRERKELDLTRRKDVEAFFQQEMPSYVIMAAARVGGIQANISHPAQFIYENLSIQTNVIHASHLYGVQKLLFYGSACSYPRECPQPMKEEYLLSGSIEPTNEYYAVAKIAGIKMCQAYNKQYGTNFICAIPTNIYGPNDNFDLSDSHVIPSLIRRFHEAKLQNITVVSIWGTGNAVREFIYVDDVADASIFLMKHYNSTEIINIGTGQETSVKNLAHIIKEEVGYTGNVEFDTSKPDGMPKKIFNISKLKNLGWIAATPLNKGIRQTYEWFIKNLKEVAI